MDLELALGRSVALMSEREFRRWQQYSERKGLPSRRLEFYLAQIAMLIAHLMGGSDAPLTSFLFDAKPKDTEVDVETLRKEFDYKPRRKRG